MGGRSNDRGGEGKRLVRLLKLLARPGVRLVADGQAAAGYAVCGCDAGLAPAAATIDGGAIEACLRRGLIERHGDGWRLNDAGRLALRRLLAGDDPFQQQHQQRVSEPRRIDGDERPVLVNDGATPLGWLARRKDADGRPLISAAQFAAGERLASDFAFAGLGPRVTTSWAGGGASSGSRQARSMPAELTDGRLAAQQRVRRALDFVGGELADLLLDVCCLQLGLGDLEAERGWPRRSGKLLLQLALDRLAEHYGLSVRAPQRYRTRIAHWGAADYRPSIGGGEGGESA